MFETITYSTSTDGIAYLTLNRPEVYNALNPKMLEEIRVAFGKAEMDKTVKVVVFTGAGKAFCSGQDLGYFKTGSQIVPSVIVKKYYNPLIMDMRNLPKVILCKLNGTAVGAGCSLALASDMILASDDATLSEAFVNIGLVPDSGSAYFLPRLVGRLKSFELLVTGRRLSSSKAFELGLINEVYASNILNDKVHEMAISIAQGPSKAISLIKNMLNRSYDYNLHEVLEMEAEMQDIAANTVDFKEGINAFIEKRKANFKGY